jgi:hypothetical protein
MLAVVLAVVLAGLVSVARHGDQTISVGPG